MILGVLDALGVQQAHFIGYSFGGRVAMQIAILAPERVQSLVALAPEAFATDRPAIARRVRTHSLVRCLILIGDSSRAHLVLSLIQHDGHTR